MPELPSYVDDYRRHVALPLGGIGTGNVALSGTGVLKQWQLHNQGNHLGFLPQSFFALRVIGVEPPFSYGRILEAPPVPVGEATPNVNDDRESPLREAREFDWPRMAGGRFEGGYPFARIAYEDATLPVQVELSAYTPFVPLDPDASALPLASFTFTVTNTSATSVTCWLASSMQNAVGWDGASPVRGAACQVLGGNENRLVALASGTALLMENHTLPGDDPGAGSMALWTAAPSVGLAQFDDAATVLAFLDAVKLTEPAVTDDWSAPAMARALKSLRPPVRSATGPSQPGRTWAGALCAPIRLAPGASQSIEFVLAWHFANRYVDFDQFGAIEPDPVPAVVGNHYATRFADAADVIVHYAGAADELRAASLAWQDAIFGSALPPVLMDVLAAQPALIRSPTTFRTADGRFFGFEGVLGESTLNWNGNIGGSCPLNCTHVWNYEQALAHLFPTLERSMRETDWDVLQAPEGYLPHRVRLPIDAPQLFGVTVGGPDRPALDGMLGTVLKTLREAQRGGGVQWLARYAPHLRRLMSHVTKTWDVTGDGVLTGDQPVTHDISLQGANMYVGGLWLATLKAMSAIATALGEDVESKHYTERFEQASAAYDDLLFNGEYYSQRSDGDNFDFGDGCLADQLFGQWWAHQLNLGYILPVEHVRTALSAILRYNLREDFTTFHHGYRVFADKNDTGLLICTWPKGGRPKVPIRYADEVWTGVEYQVAAHCLQEGLTEPGLRLLKALRTRYNGSRRNPYNEIECGDHYARAMSGWSTLEAHTNSHYNALTSTLTLGRSVPRYPLFAGTGWATVKITPAAIDLHTQGGHLEIARILLPATTSATATVELDTSPIQCTIEAAKDTQRFTFVNGPAHLTPGQTLHIYTPTP